MRLFTRDTDSKRDTPLSLWVGLAFIGLAVIMEKVHIGPGEPKLGISWTISVPMFFLITGLTALVPGLFLTILKRPE